MQNKNDLNEILKKRRNLPNRKRHPINDARWALSEYFAADSSGRLLLAKLIKNTILQAYKKININFELLTYDIISDTIQYG
jgi:hypothetical protein